MFRGWSEVPIAFQGLLGEKTKKQTGEIRVGLVFTHIVLSLYNEVLTQMPHH